LKEKILSSPALLASELKDGSLYKRQHWRYGYFISIKQKGNTKNTGQQREKILDSLTWKKVNNRTDRQH